MQWAYCVVRHTLISLEQNLSPVFRRCGTLVVPLGFDRVAESQGCIRAAYVFVHVYRQYLALIFLRRNVISHSFAFQLVPCSTQVENCFYSGTNSQGD